MGAMNQINTHAIGKNSPPAISICPLPDHARCVEPAGKSLTQLRLSGLLAPNSSEDFCIGDLELLQQFYDTNRLGFLVFRSHFGSSHFAQINFCSRSSSFLLRWQGGHRTFPSGHKLAAVPRRDSAIASSPLGFYASRLLILCTGRPGWLPPGAPRVVVTLEVPTSPGLSSPALVAQDGSLKGALPLVLHFHTLDLSVWGPLVE